MLKAAIQNAAISGLPLDGHDVARVSRSRKWITLRHSWPNNTDGLRRAYCDLAQRLANASGRAIAVYARESQSREE